MGGWLVQDVCWKGQGDVKEKLELSSFPGYEEEVLFLIFNLLYQVPQISIFPSSRSQRCLVLRQLSQQLAKSAPL